jgi:hypothetical protein
MEENRKGHVNFDHFQKQDYFLVRVQFEPRLVLFLHAGRCHTVNDRITTGIHAANNVGNCIQCEDHNHTEPQDDVEHHWVVFVVVGGQVQILKSEKFW